MKLIQPVLLAGMLTAMPLIAAEPIPGPPSGLVPPPGPGQPPTFLPSRGAAVSQATAQELVKFDLDFPGGKPAKLVEAISKAMNRPLNAVITKEHEEVELPALKLKNVDVAQLFTALESSTERMVMYTTATYGFGQGRQQKQYQNMRISCGFRAARTGQINQDTIWIFYQDKPVLPPPDIEVEKVCRFYQLGPYLSDHRIETITTAIQTGWKMLGETNPPTMNFHQDTGLLIAVGETTRLQLIDNVLEKLAPPPLAPVAPEIKESEAKTGKSPARAPAKKTDGAP